jgi:hypothetical protein
LIIDPNNRSSLLPQHVLDKLVVVSWFDNKSISIVFSPIDPISGTFATQWHLTNSFEIPTSPKLVHYLEHMCEVDVQDQFRGNYMLQMWDHKYWHSIMLML